jgi:hypothetical protein
MFKDIVEEVAPSYEVTPSREGLSLEVGC